MLAVAPSPATPIASDYRTSTSSYVAYKSKKYTEAFPTNSVVENTCAAIKRAHAKNYPVLNSNSNAVCLCVSECRQRVKGSKFVLRIGKEIQLKSTSVKNVKWVESSDNELQMFMMTNSEQSKKNYTVIAPSGIWNIKLRTSGMAKKKWIKTAGPYDLTEFSQQHSKRIVLYRIALIEAAKIEMYVAHKLPTAELHMFVKYSRKHLAVKLKGLRIVVNAKATVDKLLYMHRISYADSPHLSAAHKPKDSMPGSETALVGKVPHSVSFLKQVAAIAGSSEKDFSISASLSGKRSLSYNGAAQYRVGEVTEILTNYSALNAVMKANLNKPWELAVNDPETTRILLKKANQDALLEALEKLYKDKPIPTPAQLMTHTAGMPYFARSIDDTSPDNSLEASIYQLLFGKTEGVNSAGPEGGLAKQLTSGTGLVAPVGAVVHPSAIDSTVLGQFNREGPIATINQLCISHGMTNSYIAPVSQSGATSQQSSPDFQSLRDWEAIYAPALGLVSNTDDLVALLSEGWKSTANRGDAFDRRALSTSMTPMLLSANHPYIEGIGLGSWKITMCAFKRSKLDRNASGGSAKEAMAVCYKFGAVAGVSNCLLVFVPALHLGVAYASRMPSELLFSNANKKKRDFLAGCCAYNPTDKEKGHGMLHLRSFIKHLVIAAAHDSFAPGTLISSYIDRDLNDAFSNTPHIPPRLVPHIAMSTSLPVAPEPGSKWETMLAHKDVVKDLYNKRLLPLFPGMEIVASSALKQESKATLTQRLASATGAIYLYTPEKHGCEQYPVDNSLLVYDYYIHDERTRMERGLRWDQTSNSFVLMRTNYGDGNPIATDRVEIAFIGGSKSGSSNFEDMAPVLRYAGRVYISADSLLQVGVLMAKHLDDQNARKRRTEQRQEKEAFAPWALGGSAYVRSELSAPETASPSLPKVQWVSLEMVADQLTQQAPTKIEASIVPFLGGAALGGLAGYAIARATTPRPVVMVNPAQPVYAPAYPSDYYYYRRPRPLVVAAPPPPVYYY